MLQAQAVAEKTRLEGEAQANIVRLQGQAEADVILAKGQSEAEAMQIKAAAFQEYNQAAVLDKLLTEMPAMVRAIAEPLNRVDSITVVSTGGDGQGGGTTGVNRLAGDMTALVAQVPALLEALTGVRMDELLKHVPETGDRYRQSGGKVTPARKPSDHDPRAPFVDAEPVEPDSAKVNGGAASEREKQEA